VRLLPALRPTVSTFSTLPITRRDDCSASEYLLTVEFALRVFERQFGALAACPKCSLKSQCTTGPERRITRWEHEHLLEAVQQRLDANPQAMRRRRETVEHPFGTIKALMGATHFLTKTLPKVAAEMALSVLAYNMTRVMNIVGIKPLTAAIAA
jgi:Transposase DDE domain